MPSPLVSVILATYNGSRFLEQSIQSVLAQTFSDFELIVVDDGSTDPQVRAICERYADRLQYIYQENRGLAGARNTGIRRSRGEFICFIDDDDAWKPDKLTKQIAFMRGFGPEDNVGMVSTWLELIDPEGRRIGWQGHDLSGDVYRQLFFDSPVDAPSSVMIRREVFEQVGLHDESLRYAEDRDMWLRISRHFRIRSLNEHLVYYRVRPDSQSRNTERQIQCVNAGLEKAFEAACDDPEVQTIRPRAIASLQLRWAMGRFFQADCRGCRERFRLACELMPGLATRYHRLIYLASYLGTPFVRALLRVYRAGKSVMRKVVISSKPIVLPQSGSEQLPRARLLPRPLRITVAAARELVFLIRLGLSFALMPIRWLLPSRWGIALYNALWFSRRRANLDSLDCWYEYDRSLEPYSSLLDPDIWLRDRYVVDLGAGSGGKAISCVRGGARLVIGIEIDAHRLAEAQALAAANLAGSVRQRLTLLRASAYELPLQDSVADTVISYTVFEHLSQPRDALAEAFRVLRSGGHMLLYYHYFCSPYGAHMVQFIKFPWPTLFFSDSDLTQYYNRRLSGDRARGLCQATFAAGQDLSDCAHDHFTSLNRLSPDDFESMLADRPWQVLKSGYYGPRRALLWLGRLRPAWRRYAYDGKYYLLQKP